MKNLNKIFIAVVIGVPLTTFLTACAYFFAKLLFGVLY